MAGTRVAKPPVMRNWKRRMVSAVVAIAAIGSLAGFNACNDRAPCTTDDDCGRYGFCTRGACYYNGS